MSFNEKNAKHVTQLFHYNVIIFIVLRCLNCFCMVINHLKSMKYILIIISFINTTLWKLAKLRGITPPPSPITLIPIWLPPHQAFLPNRHFMKDPYIDNVTISLPPPQGFWFLRLGVGFFCLIYLIFFGLSRFWITCRSTTPPVPLPKTMLRGYMPKSTNRS